LHLFWTEPPDRTVLHLDWLGSITPNEARTGQPRIDTHFTVAQGKSFYGLYSSVYQTQDVQKDYNGKALHGSSALSQMFRLRPGTFYVYSGSGGGSPLQRADAHNAALTYYNFLVMITDATTTNRRLRDLTEDGSLPLTVYSRLRPTSVRCCEIRDPYQRIRVLLPCSEVVRMFYAPTMPFLVRTYQGLYLDRTSILNERGIGFNGTKYYRYSEPLVSHRNPSSAEMHFAEAQLRALVNRAIMANQRENIFPIEAMPPFRGQALFSGRGVRYTSKDGWTSYLLTTDTYCCREPDEQAAISFATQTGIISLHDLAAPERDDLLALPHNSNSDVERDA
jgi:hypothetical protein